MRHLSIALIALILGACGPKENTVKIAVAMPLTGDMGTEGQGVRRAVELAVEQANQSKRFPFKLEAAPFDDRADPKEAVNVANLIVSDSRIVGVVGHYNSGCAIPAAKVYARGGIPMISPAATNPEVTAQQFGKDWAGPHVVFRVVPTDDAQGAYAADFVYKKLGKKKMSLLHDKTPYGQGLAEQFKKTYLAAGGQIVTEDGVSVGDKDFKALLTRLKAAGADGIYFGGLYPEGGLIIKQMRELGMKQIYVSGDGSRTPGLIDVGGDSVEGAFATMPGKPVEQLPQAKKFIEDYKARYKGADQELKPFDHYGYEATNIILAALEKVGPDRAKLTEEIRKIKFDGVLGSTVFDEKGDTLNKTIVMTRASVKDRTFPEVK